MDSPIRTRYARQWVLAGVGTTGQEAWGNSWFVLSGAGTAFESCREALLRAGAGHVRAWNESQEAQDAFYVILSSDPAERLRVSRVSRKSRRPALFGWTLQDGYALALFPHRDPCPCYECFLSSNPPSIVPHDNAWEAVLGAHAAAEALLAVLAASPIENRAWLTYAATGQTAKHAVRPSGSCAARFADTGAGR
jgi:hypothetical protein